MQGINLVVGKVNSLDYATSMFSLPTANEMLKRFIS